MNGQEKTNSEETIELLLVKNKQLGEALREAMDRIEELEEALRLYRGES